MQKEAKTFGSVTPEGKLTIYNRDLFYQTIEGKFKSTSIELVIKERFYKFNDSQRSYYFGVIIPEMQMAFRSLGVIKSRDEIDKEMRDKFLYYEEVNPDTGQYEKFLHTLKNGDTSVSKKMMREYCELCIIWSVQNLEWAIPYPNEVMSEDDYTDHQKNIKNIGAKDKSTV